VKPVLIQHLLKKNKNKSGDTPISENEREYYNNKAASFVIWFVVVLVLVGLLIA
jgi:hypothetical protein